MKKIELNCRHLSKPSARANPGLPAIRGSWRSLPAVASLILTAAICPSLAFANNPGAVNGSGPVTFVDNGSTVTLSNGTVSININKNRPSLNSVKYTHTNSGSAVTTELLAGSGQYYNGGSGPGGSTWVYALATNPASNGGALGDVTLTATDTTGKTTWHFSLLKGSSGFYTTAIPSHTTGDAAFSFSAFGLNSRWSSVFNWLSVDSARNFYLGSLPANFCGAGAFAAGHEMIYDADGSNPSAYDDKFIYGQDHVDKKAWGWSSVGTSGLNVGVWEMSNLEYSDGGPLKRDVSSYPAGGSVGLLVNNFLTEELNQGTDSGLAQGEVFTKVCGPWFTYLNSVPTSITDKAQAANALFADANAQDAAEKGGWPYYWFVDSNYPLAAGRGTVTGQLRLADSGNVNPVVAGTWVGLEQEPNPVGGGVNDFQQWKKPYQYWTQTDSGGYFTFNDVRPGTNYTLVAYGRGIAGTFMSQNLQGGNPPLELDVPSPAMAPIVVTAGGTTNIPSPINWNAQRVGATVFEIGYPDRKGDKFRHGEDYWVPDAPPVVGYPTGYWGGEVRLAAEYPGDPGNGIAPLTFNYNVGTSKWATDWNYILYSLPALDQNNHKYLPATGNINFNLETAPAANAQASFYLGVAASSFDTRTNNGQNEKLACLLITVNGHAVLTGDPGTTTAPNTIDPLAPAKFYGLNGPGGVYTDDSSQHCSIHGPFWDERITFPASLLQAGANTISVTAQPNIQGSQGGYAILDYLRLELQGYVPPTPPRTAVFPGNNRNLVTWQVQPGATRYNLLRSGNPTSGFTTLQSGILGRDYVSGNGATIMTYTDTSAVNGQNYYYDVESVNPTGTSASSGAPPRGTPFASPVQTVPAAPTGLALNNTAHHQVALYWSASPGASFYRVYRTTMHPDNAGNYYSIQPNGATMLSDFTTGTSFTDNTPSDGVPYSYSVTAVNAAGTSSSSAGLIAKAMPAAPGSAVQNLTASRISDPVDRSPDVYLSWTPVPGATGYTVYGSTTAGGPFTFPSALKKTMTTSYYLDKGVDANTTYYYQVTPVNIAGISSPATVTAAP